nr:MAG: capsid protein [Owegonang virus 19]
MAYKKKYVSRKPRAPRGKRAIVRKALKSSWKKSVAKVCKRVIATRAEVKGQSVAQRNVLSQTQACSSDSTFFRQNNIIQLTPNASNLVIQQGDGDSDRTGSSIYTKRVMFKGLICPTNIDTIYNPSPARPMEVRMVICSIKPQLVQSPTSLLNICQASIFNENNSSYPLTSSGTVANLWDMMRTLNTDLIQVHKVKIFKIGGQPGNTGTASGGNTNPNLPDFNYNSKFSIDVTKYCPKRVTFNDASYDSTSKQLFALFIVCDATGNTPSSNPNRPLALYHNINYEFTDM